jgi:hypothetical protein
MYRGRWKQVKERNGVVRDQMNVPLQLQVFSAFWCGEWCPSAFKIFELPSWMLYQAVQLLQDSGLVRGESGYSL